MRRPGVAGRGPRTLRAREAAGEVVDQGLVGIEVILDPVDVSAADPGRPPQPTLARVAYESWD